MISRANKTQQKQTKTPHKSFFQSAPASVMVPRLMVIFPVAGLLILGLVMVYSASSIVGYVESGSSISEGLKQIGFAVAGLVAAGAIILFVKTSSLQGKLGLIFWAICMLLLVLTFLMGTIGLGARRWLFIGPVGIQPSEFAKIALTIMAAQIICARNSGELTQNQALARFLGMVIAPIVFLLITQSDLGTAAICFVAIIAALWLAGISTRFLLIVLGCLVVGGVIAIATQSYRLERLSFLDPWADPSDTGYQLIHSLKALAAGGLFGVGVGNSYEKLMYLPEAETDFIFAILGEELGLIGTVGVLALFLVFLYGSFRIARNASSEFGLVLAGSLATMLVFQAFLNILCVVGWFPTTGKPLPFISSGGSSLISSLMVVGIILSISFSSDESKRHIKERRDNLHVVSSYTSSARLGRKPNYTTPPSAPRRGGNTPHRIANGRSYSRGSTRRG